MFENLRKRYTLLEKKKFVELFKTEKFELYRDNIKNGTNNEVSIKEFCANNKIRKDSMFCNWLRMDRLGELESWNGINDLSKFNFKPKDVNVLNCINEGNIVTIIM